MFGMSLSHVLLFAVVALLLFGNRLPATMRSLGQSLTEFKKGLRLGDEDQTELER